MNLVNQSGYKKRPLELVLLASVFALVPFLSWASWYAPYLLAGRPESLLEVLVANFATASNGPWGLVHAVLMVGLWVLFLLVAWGIWKVTNWGFYLCILTAVANSLFSTFLYGVSKADGVVEEIVKFNPFQFGTLLNLVFFIPIIIILRKDIMAPFFNPKMKWWEQHPRVKALLTIEASIGGTMQTFKSFDISASGMFLGTDNLGNLPLGDGYYEGFPAKVHLEETGEIVELSCRVVYVSGGGPNKPTGFGVTFEYKDSKQRKVLATYLHDKIRNGQVANRT